MGLLAGVRPVVPVGAVALGVLLATVPAAYPNVRKSQNNPTDTVLAPIKNRGAYRKLDLLGALSLLAGSMFIITALEEARYDYRWSSALVIVFLILSALSWSVFVLWSWYLHSKTSTNIESVFTWRFFETRIFAGMILSTFLCGVPFTVPAIQFPQRFQAVSALSPLQAAVRFLPFGLTGPVGSAVAAMAMTKYKVSPVFVLAAGGILQTIGTSLFSYLPVSGGVTAATYGYETLIGVGGGFNIGGLILLTPFVVKGKDQGMYRLLGIFGDEIVWLIDLCYLGQLSRWALSINFESLEGR
ncbi:MAG: hypothetical protein Q9162_007220 [Coniocarpon cinnabarinum]